MKTASTFPPKTRIGVTPCVRGRVILGFVACSASRNFIAYVGQSVPLQMETNRFSAAIVIGLGGAKKKRGTMRWKNNAGVPILCHPYKTRRTCVRHDITRPDSLVERRLIRDDCHREHRLRPGVAALLGVSRFRRIR